MAGKARRHPKVRIEWDKRRVQEGKMDARLIWERQGVVEGRISLGYVSPEEAEEARADQEARLRLGLSTPTSPASSPPVPPALPTVADAAAYYIVTLLPKMPGGVAHHRLETTHAMHLDRLLGDAALNALTLTRVQQYVAKRKSEPLAPRGNVGRPRKHPGAAPPPKERTDETPHRITVMGEISTLRRMVRAWHEGKGTVPPVLPKTRDIFAGWEEDHRPPRQLTEDEVRQLVAAATYTVRQGPHVGKDRSHIGRLIGFLAWCPRRPVAVFALRRRHCVAVLDRALLRKRVRIWFERDKGGKGRGWSPLTQPAFRILREQLEATEGGPDDLVWQTDAGNAWTAETFWKVVQQAARKAGIDDVTTYDLRKFGAARVYRRKPNLKVVMQYTGHKNPAILLKNYLFPEKDEAEEAAETIDWRAPVFQLAASNHPPQDPPHGSDDAD